MMRWRDWVLIRTARWHLTTDPQCTHYKPTRQHSRLDLRSRGRMCARCARMRALETITTTIWPRRAGKGKLPHD